jgi:hypothetical protein
MEMAVKEEKRETSSGGMKLLKISIEFSFLLPSFSSLFLLLVSGKFFSPHSLSRCCCLLLCSSSLMKMNMCNLRFYYACCSMPAGL